MITLMWIVLFVAAIGVLAFQRASLMVWTIALGFLLLVLTTLGYAHPVLITLCWVIYLILFVPLNIIPFRREFISRRILSFFRKVMPTMSDTEKEALQAGSVGWNADLFSGKPDWTKLLNNKLARLTEEEQAFLDGPVEVLCSMIDNWTISRSMKIPDQIWNHLKKEGFFGIIIPKSYGGLEFSALAHSQVISKIASVSTAVGTVTSVPNSLGPAELLLHYGTEEQKNYYLPRLAKGEEMPCFALTSPVAGSDAGSITDYGIVVKEVFEGKEQLCIRLNWNKRYITLAPIATILGLAFKLYDPDHLLGSKEEIGITCALIPTNLPNVEIGRRHYPLDCAFPNGPTVGKDVIIPMDWVIGGQKMVGTGWRMLMECLSAGRSISLPSMVTGGARMAALASAAYSRIRRQFNTYIANFGGVEEAITRCVAYSYLMDAVRVFTVSALDQHQKPAVASAISKYHTTELARIVTKDAMDIHGGKGICMGPNNYIAQGRIELPISITVEGANILTRSMIIFGQGAIRCHPYVLAEMTSAADEDQERGLHAFDRAVFGHIGFVISNKVRTFVLGLTNGRLARVPAGPFKRYYQRFSRYSAALAFCADVSMAVLGGELKRLEKISGRLGDLLSYLYMGSALLKYYETGFRGEVREEEKVLVEWLCQDLLHRLQTQMDVFLTNFPNRFVARCLRIIVFPFGRCYSGPSDKLGEKVARLSLEPSIVRERLWDNLYSTPNENNPVGQIEVVLKKVIEIEPLEQKISKALKKREIKGKNLEELVAASVAAHILTRQEGDKVLETDQARMKVINVDDFGPEFFEK